MDLLSNVWREACQHIEIEESVDRIARLLADELPADAILVRRLDAQRSRIDTVTTGQCVPGPVPSATRSVCTAEQFDAVVRWCRGGTLLHAASAVTEPLLTFLAPSGVTGDWLAAPLMRDEHPLGVLLFLARPPRRFDASHHRLALALVDPIAVALTNDARLHELARLREAVEADNRALLSRLDRDSVTDAIVGADAGLRSVMERVDQVAPTDAPVLIFGETGTGKEVVARAIHSRSRRATAPVLRVNCGALPPGLIDSELFGHERGSFTGATTVRRGWFERADGGTLFLDEIGELPLDAQVRLLRILQDGTFDRIGGQKPLSVDVRIVAATNRDLQDMVARAAFREDLWYRISVFPITLPPLRERPEDIPPLAAHFAWRAGKRLGGQPLPLSAADIELLLAYAWPGNVRELAAVVERAAILGNGRELQLEAALGGHSAPGSAAVPRKQVTAAQVSPPASAEIISLDAALKRHIEFALRATHGRIEGPQGAAARLGVNPHTLRARMRKLGVNWARFRAPRES